MANICEKCMHRNVCRYQEPCEECNQFAEKVVRCKDCKHYLPHPKSERKCCYVHITTPHFMLEDGFCSYGERRAGE